MPGEPGQVVLRARGVLDQQAGQLEPVLIVVELRQILAAAEAVRPVHDEDVGLDRVGLHRVQQLLEHGALQERAPAPRLGPDRHLGLGGKHVALALDVGVVDAPLLLERLLLLVRRAPEVLDRHERRAVPHGYFSLSISVLII
ncbi:MAG: hypothetical protein ABIO70_32975 [Pseudomonadota bacterium]